MMVIMMTMMIMMMTTINLMTMMMMMVMVIIALLLPYGYSKHSCCFRRHTTHVSKSTGFLILSFKIEKLN